MRNILIVIGSVRKESINRKLATSLTHIGKDLANFTLASIADIPMYCQDDDNNVPTSVIQFKAQIATADGIIFVTPEYNRSIPPLLKNAIDWGSRPWGQNSWSGKPAALAGISIGAIGTAVAQAHLRNSLTMLGMHLMGQPEVYLTDQPGFFDADGLISAESTRKFLHGYLQSFINWIEQHKK